MRFLRQFISLLQVLVLELQTHNQLLKRHMKELDQLGINIAVLTASVDAAVAALGNSATPAQIQAAADAVSAQTVRLTAAITPSAPPAAP